MPQFDLHRNPVPAARRAYPYVLCLQADLAATGGDAVVAPLVPRHGYSGGAGRLNPVIQVDDEEYVVVVHFLSAMPRRDLGSRVANVARFRPVLLAAVDLLFFGV